MSKLDAVLNKTYDVLPTASGRQGTEFIPLELSGYRTEETGTSSQTSSLEIPNELTRRAIEESRQGDNVVVAKDFEDLIRQLDD